MEIKGRGRLTYRAQISLKISVSIRETVGEVAHIIRELKSVCETEGEVAGFGATRSLSRGGGV